MKIRIDDVLELCRRVDTSKNKQVEKLVKYFQEEFGDCEDWDGLCYCGSENLVKWNEDIDEKQLQETYRYKCTDCLEIVEPFLINSIAIKVKEK